MDNKSKNVVFLLSILALIFISNVQAKASSNPSQIVAPEFNSRGDLVYIYKNGKGKVILETINIKTNEFSVKTIPLPTNAFSPVIKKDRYGRIWIIWEERRYDHSRLLLGMLEDDMITYSQIISNQEGFNCSPVLYFDVNNIPWVTWINYQNTKYCIFVQEMASRRAWEIKSSSFSAFSSPKIIIDHNNLVWVFWSGKEGDERGLFYRTFNHYKWSPQKKIQQGNNFPHVNPDVTIDYKGFIWLVWSGYDGSDYEIYYSFWDGINWSEKIKITENNYKSDISPSISTVAGKVPIITWAQSGPRESQVYFTFLENDIWSEKLKISFVGSQNRFPKIVVDAEKIGIIWQSGDEVQAEVVYFNQLKDIHNFYCPDSPSRIFSITLLDENKFIGFGNSITYGTFYYGPDPEKGYIPRLENLLNHHYRDQIVVNEGKGGEITAEGLARIENVIIENSAKYLLLMEGTNDIDIDLGLLIDTIAFNLREIVQKCIDHSVFPAIASIIPQTGNFWELHRYRTYEINQKIEQLAEDLSIPFVDQFDTFYNYPEEQGELESLFSDQVHPNEAGYQLMAEKWFEEIKNFSYAPLNFTGQKVLNRSLSQAEYINVLDWEANPRSENVEKYRIYEVEGEIKSLLVELYADIFEYWHRRVDKDKQYTYAICAVNNEGREGQFVYVKLIK